MKHKTPNLTQAKPARFAPLMDMETALTIEAAAAMQGVPPQQFVRDAALQHALVTLEAEAGQRLNRQLATA